MPASALPKTIEIYRKADAPLLSETQAMTYPELSPVSAEGVGKLAPLAQAGSETRLLVDLPGFSLVHAWFKSGFPLPVHSHDADCLYYIVAGSLQMGTETLGPGDSFFVGSGKRYSYTPGPEGAEVLEFRQKGEFDIRFYSESLAPWLRAAETARARQSAWASERPPSATRE